MGNSCISGDEGDFKSTRKEEDSDGQRRSSHPLPGPPEVNWPLFVGKYDYDSGTKEDLSFKKGDLLYVINTEDVYWWFAQHKDSGDKGFVPSSFIAEYQSLDAEEWFFGKMKLIDAEMQLLQYFNRQGSFLVRNSETTAGDYSLAVRDTDHVRHYRIRRLDTGGFFVTRRVTFETIQELVEYYKQQGDGLCTNLKQVCLLAEVPQTPGLSNSSLKQACAINELKEVMILDQAWRNATGWQIYEEALTA